MVQKLLRIEPGRAGITRQRAGAGFTYRASNGRRISSKKLLQRIDELAIPPGWSDVWIASQGNAHIQATGLDAAGRTQYLYHQQWKDDRDQEKFMRSLAFARRLPTIRRIVTRDLKQTVDGRRRALAAAIRIIDRAGLRVGGASYAEENGSFGVATLQRRHVIAHDDGVELSFRGKSGGDWAVQIRDGLLRDYHASIPRNPRAGPALCVEIHEGRRKFWEPITDTEINSYLGNIAGQGFTAKDFRTWQGTVVAAISLARSRQSQLPSAEAVVAAIDTAATWLHNTPTIARSSYVNPRVIVLFQQGTVASLKRQPDSAVLALLTE